MKQVRQMANDVEAIVERQHQQVSGQNGNVVPHEVLLEEMRWIGARLVHDATHAANHLFGDQLYVGRCKRDRCVGHDVHLVRGHIGINRLDDEVVKHHIDELWNAANGNPHFGLYGRVHLLLVDSEQNEAFE